MSALGVCRELILISFTPWLQPGDLDAIKPVNRFNGLLRCACTFFREQFFRLKFFQSHLNFLVLGASPEKPLKRFLDSFGRLYHRAEAAV
jgi:hypothetical protein